MELSFSLQRADNGKLYGMVFNTVWELNRPRTYLQDIAEGTYQEINQWLRENYPNLNRLRLQDGSVEEPDCLTLMEAAEIAMA